MFVRVDAAKNVSDLLLDGEVIKNVSVNSFIEIRKGFLSIIGKVEGERVEEVPGSPREGAPTIRRTITVSLSGYVDETGAFQGGTRELPLIGNEAYIATAALLRVVHRLVKSGEAGINVATHYDDGFDVELPIDGLFNSHIAIFGNTGSGKSNTLARLYSELVRVLSARNQSAFTSATRILLFDFNGEFSAEHCITTAKHVYRLSTASDDGDPLPLDDGGILDPEIVAILGDATEKTQKPFIRRALRKLDRARKQDDPAGFLRGILQRQVRDALEMNDRVRPPQVVAQLCDLFKTDDHDTEPLDGDIEWHAGQQWYKPRGSNRAFKEQPSAVTGTALYQAASQYNLPDGILSPVLAILQIQLIDDVLRNRAQLEHVSPVVNRLQAREGAIARLLDLEQTGSLWKSNVVVLNLTDVSLEMKKTIPLLVAKSEYARHKREGAKGTLSIVIDEAHNILSTESFRESETWKDYRLETFEEIIKEGRKFGVFVTISSQRPSDISPTITSQAHNYFIHRLINQFDLNAVAGAVSYIDRLAQESIPTLPTGTCVFSGVASGMPVRLNMRLLPEEARPQSKTREFKDIVPASSESAEPGPG